MDFLYKKFIFIFFILSSIAWADKNCLEIEGLKLGCISAADHSCFRNTAIPIKANSCRYAAQPSTAFRAESPVAFNCKSFQQVKVCQKNSGNGDQSGETCTTHSECVEWLPPVCKEECVPCYEKVVTADVGLSAGCIICNRKPCDDEKPYLTQKTCPYYLDSNTDPEKRLTLSSVIECSNFQRCPSTAVVPSGPNKGQTVNVIITQGSCEKPKVPNFPEENKLEKPKLCLWKEDERGPDIEGEAENNRSNCQRKISCKNSNYPNSKDAPCEDR